MCISPYHHLALGTTIEIKYVGGGVQSDDGGFQIFPDTNTLLVPSMRVLRAVLMDSTPIQYSSPCKVNLIKSDVIWSSYQVGDTRIIAGSYPCTSGCGSSLTSVCLTSGLPPIYSRVSREKLGLPMVYYRILGRPHGYPIFWTKGRNQYRTLNWLVHSQDFAFHQCVPESDSKEITNARGDHIPFRCLSMAQTMASLW